MCGIAATSVVRLYGMVWYGMVCHGWNGICSWGEVMEHASVTCLPPTIVNHLSLTHLN